MFRDSSNTSKSNSVFFANRLFQEEEEEEEAKDFKKKTG